ncbi:bifunctional 4-hydroxy-2-oxoglutarate aldolase/2-dehydro-3-deoxy-phosphogluconate aldolase [Leifsonia sp. AG29]|uniref:bifunctional 4-hydroxy-2-oxoglutarate aldolase/2-dehydro-3-deoxy-phosphogluconate aldolase n=1 Tax=Leifsonia sp. AG29 TaxID=2598860 RepID=UPI00131D35E8|nr:bifunctional 4-hydroxy-2-oxoglutarate aldolase/2-dehydro-3-deoxy-phosphogluconate aldolase [Leifsonia sp. AG29]
MKLALSRLTATGVIAVVRAPSAEAAVGAARALAAGGVTGIEITYSTPDAASAISRIADELGETVLLGAGTVRTPDQAREAADAGAAFLVAPGFRPAVADAMTATGLTTMIGAITPSEVMAAEESGADVVKLFPAGLFGPTLVRNLRGPFPDVPFMPTGGVNAANIAEWVAAGVVAVGAGSDLVSSADLAAGSYVTITAKASEFSAAYRAAVGKAAA